MSGAFSSNLSTLRKSRTNVAIEDVPRPEYLSPLLAKNAHMRPDPSSLPRAGRQNTLRGEANGRFNRRRAFENSPDLHVSSGSQQPFTAVSVAHETLPNHGVQRRVHMAKGLGPMVAGTLPPVEASNRCGIGRSVTGVTDTASWSSVKRLTIDDVGARPALGAAPGSGIGAQKQAEWRREADALRGAKAWGSEMRSRVGDATKCYEQAREAAVARQRHLAEKRDGCGVHARTGVASAPFATDAN